MVPRKCLRIGLAGCFLALFLACRTEAALEADQIVLVVNSKVPAGMKLARFYAQQRHIPDGRIISLNLPDGDDIGFDAYDNQVVPAVRKFLRENKLDKKVTCLVTFYGVPLRIGRRPSTPAENDEVRELTEEIKRHSDRARTAVEGIEALAKELDPAFKPPTMRPDPPLLAPRAEAAMGSVVKTLSNEKAATRRAASMSRLVPLMTTLIGPLETTQRLAIPPLAQLAVNPPTAEEGAAAQAKALKVIDELNGLRPHFDEPKLRAKARDLIRDEFGAFGYLNVIGEHRASLITDETEAAFDNELALLWWPDGYIRHRWHLNPLNLRNRLAVRPGPRPPTDATVMVMRIDAPTEQLAHDLIVNSIAVEKDGLKGLVALDARGKPANDAYGVYDQTLRNLATLLKEKSTLSVVLDDKEALFEPGSLKGVAVYCGWYSLRKYVPGMVFKPGAVGFHVASSELVALHHPRETGWVHGLMTDGVVGSLGPVAEPYLHSFPPADEFFPLLFTGKLTLAEVYWASNPLVSWMNACIGDPLYRPYAANPALKVEDLPPKLKAAFN